MVAKKWATTGSVSGGMGLKMGASMNVVKQGGVLSAGGVDSSNTTAEGDDSAAGDAAVVEGDSEAPKSAGGDAMEGSVPAQEAQPGTHTATLAVLPSAWLSLLQYLFFISCYTKPVQNILI